MLSLLAGIAGCAAVPRGPLPAGDDAAEACRALFERVDAEVRLARVRDGAAAPIDGFPWLRTSRVLASFREEAVAPDQFDAWIAHLAALDEEGRGYEFKNLGADARRRLHADWQEAAGRHGLEPVPPTAIATCRQLLNDRLRTDRKARRKLRAAALVPDDYVLWQRVLGLYPLASIIARSRILVLHAELGERFVDGVPDSALTVHHAVPSPGIRRSPAAVARTLPRDALGIPLPDEAARAALMGAHAPLWAIETLREADLPGALVFEPGSGLLRPVVDVDEPLEYRWLSWTRFAGNVLLQLNYALWFPERPPAARIDIAAGHLDSVIWRVTLDVDGGVLAYDSIHSCGCYYTLFPGDGWQAATPGSDEEPLFAPRPAPLPGEGERVLVGLESGTHYIVEVAAREPPAGVRPLAAAAMPELRSLTAPQGRQASVYRPDGLIPASRRPERFLLWPLGVPSAGAMRQPGRQPSAFVGRRHFDDARLLEQLLQREAPR
jgi:hypothetical protein